ncbi:LysR family transcriptional regulator [Pseudoalteromonas luteoviolacea]|uniref:LysR family transcriptional regulator n=1 Tax=Pseudoalteromonas luteoviolacea TaxID=43657 RepID=UPI001B38177F|nr:LysR family transcriptional regulator [Pseudoalteromonas luteoviolacea]MBQ4813299.1 LysR family transcriptional regulator [Pseudoalteromonas luteoviolacea]
MAIELSNEQLFLHVVEAGSFKAAAEQLGIDPSLVSRRIVSLEQRLNVKLMTRSTKRSYPTEAGEQYYQGLRKLLDEQQALESQISQTNEIPSGKLRVAAPHDFARQFVLPVLTQMNELYASLSIELILSSQYEDLIGQGIDVAIRVGELPDSSLRSKKLGEVRRVLVASSAYLMRKGVPTDIAMLSEHDFIFYSGAQAQKPIEIGAKSVKVQGRFIVNSVSALRDLVLQGQGIHLGPKWAFNEALASGDVVQLFKDQPLKGFPLHALYPCRAFVPAKVRVFIDTLYAQCQQQGLG